MLDLKSQKVLIKILFDLDCEVEKEFRKGSTFYATATAEITEKEVREFASEYDLTPLLNKRIVGIGYWDDYNGLEINQAWIEEQSIRMIPERTIVIPAQEEVTWVKSEV